MGCTVGASESHYLEPEVAGLVQDLRQVENSSTSGCDGEKWDLAHLIRVDEHLIDFFFVVVEKFELFPNNRIWFWIWYVPNDEK